jgi:hypothetical protein
MRAARDGKDSTDYWKAEVELRTLLPPVEGPVT